MTGTARRFLLKARNVQVLIKKEFFGANCTRRSNGIVFGAFSRLGGVAFSHNFGKRIIGSRDTLVKGFVWDCRACRRLEVCGLWRARARFFFNFFVSLFSLNISLYGLVRLGDECGSCGK